MLAVVPVAQFIVILDSSVVNVALPMIKGELGFSEQNLSWILNAYTLGSVDFCFWGGVPATALAGVVSSLPASPCSRRRR